jgi:phosphoenolpyruvate---glycerone phosphotransferase subunit DhaL
MITSADLQGMIRAISKVIQANRTQLNALDAELGDGDHGTTIAAGFEAAVTEMQPAQSPADVLSAVAQVLMNRMGGSSGALFGTLFLRAAMQVKEQASLSDAQFAAMWQAGTEAVMARGQAQPGDKTMVDALVPATAALSQAVANGKPLQMALEAAAHAAAQGADSTAALLAKQGRARYVGERAVGHVDAGARSVALIFEAMHTYWKENHDGEA